MQKPFYIKSAVEAGIDCIEHPLPRDDETIRLMAQRGTYAVPTVIATGGYSRNTVGTTTCYHGVSTSMFLEY
jgi:imidazolonepropionase-like amidohydrolase